MNECPPRPWWRFWRGQHRWKELDYEETMAEYANCKTGIQVHYHTRCRDCGIPGIGYVDY